MGLRALALSLILPSLAGAQLTATAEPIIGARSLALNADGTKLAFSYQGDIWTVSTKGGKAERLTNHVELEDNPVWSPDGQWIAFSSNRFGNNEIFVIPAEGGSVKRLTWNSNPDVPSDWSADGKQILFSGRRDNTNSALLTLDVATGRLNQLLLDPVAIGNPKFSPDGKSVLYTRFGFPFVRPRYQGSAASQLWSVDLSTGKRTEWRNNGFQHLWPQFALGGKSVLTVTVGEKTPSSSMLGKPIPKVIDSAKLTPNVYAVDAPGKARRLTDYVGTNVRYLTVSRDGQTAAYEVDGSATVLKLGEKPTTLKITASLDDKTNQEERLVLTSGVSDLSLSPDNKLFAFVVRGEVWTVPLEKGKGPNADDATQITDWEGVDDQPLWTPDGKGLFLTSDRDGGKRLYRLAVDTKAITAITKDDADVVSLQYTPDKKTLGFWKSGKTGGLYEVPIEGGTPVRVIARPDNYEVGNETSYSYSPDNRYIAFSQTLNRSGYYYWESTADVFIFDRETGKTFNVTKLSAAHGNPRFSPDGRFLFIQSDRDGAGLYVIPLQSEDARSTELEIKWEKPKAPVKVTIDFEDIDNRIRKVVSQEGRGLEIDPETGDLIYIVAGDIWRAKYDGSEGKAITTGGNISGFDFSQDGKLIQFLRGGVMSTLNPRLRDEQKAISFRSDWTRDLRKERRAAYEQFWRSFNRGFYDPNFHGRDWAGLKQRYLKYLPSVGHRSEMATVLNLLVGELESSHSEVSAAPNPSAQSAHLGFTFDYSYAGPGIKIAEVPARSPGSFAKTKLAAGEVVEKINGKPVAVNEALYRDVLNGENGRDLTLSVKGADGKVRDVKYRALSGGEYSGLVFENRLRERRKLVEEKSGGKLTYVHIAGMSQGELDRFMKQVWEYAHEKKGLIIDVRNNGGGNTSDRIIDILERRPNSYYQLRDQDPILGPGQTLDMPIVVMCAESSFSNAEMFPYAMKARGLAKLVGKPTPGYVIYTYGLPLIDGTSARMPTTGVFRLDGSPLENIGQVPDFVVDISPEQFLRGEDPQLQKAIEVLLNGLK
jgi:Tol biopolymer transport system component/C-terminal processing protease CtpA/Prc